MTLYRVTAPYVTVRVNPGAGETVLGFYEGGILPDSAIQESVDSLLAKGMVEKVDADEAKKIEKAQAEQEKAEAEMAAAEAKRAEEERAAADKAAAEEEAKAKKAAGVPLAKAAPKTNG